MSLIYSAVGFVDFLKKTYTEEKSRGKNINDTECYVLKEYYTVVQFHSLSNVYIYIGKSIVVKK